MRAVSTVISILACLLTCKAGLHAQTDATPLGKGSEGSTATSNSIHRLPLPVIQTAPLMVFTTPEDTTVVELPYAVDDWYGRGFTLNPDAQAGDFALRLNRGDRRFSVTPLTAGAHRVLTLVVKNRLLALEFVPATTRYAAIRGIVFYDEQIEQALIRKTVDDERNRRTTVVRSAAPPKTAYRDGSTETLVGLSRFMRMLMNMPEDMAARAVQANPSMQLVKHVGPETPFGDFSLKLEFAVRDSSTDTLGFCVSVTNNTARRLVFDPQSWLVRAGERVYPIRTGDFAGHVEPSARAVAFLVLDRAPDGKPTRLLPDNDFRISVQQTQSLSPRPVMGIDLTQPFGDPNKK